MVNKRIEDTLGVFRSNYGILRTGQAKKLGINERTLSEMEADGLLVKEARGLFRLADLPPLSNPDLVKVAVRIPMSVICLISALNFHSLTTQIPYKVYAALPRGVKRPRIEYPPIEFIWPIDRIYEAGIEEHFMDGVVVRIYSREKTVADCFKYRGKIGLTVAVEALKDCMSSESCNREALFKYSKINKVYRVMKPYMETFE